MSKTKLKTLRLQEKTIEGVEKMAVKENRNFLVRFVHAALQTGEFFFGSGKVAEHDKVVTDLVA